MTGSRTMFSPAYPLADSLEFAWRLPAGLALAVRTIGDSLAIFNAESGDTHLLHPGAGAVLERLVAGEILAGAALADAADALEREGLDAPEVLRELHVLGLAEPFLP